MTPQDFSAKIKAKYPQYAQLDDVDLANRMIAKYPQYKSQVVFEQPKPKTLGQKVLGGASKAADAVVNFIPGLRTAVENFATEGAALTARNQQEANIIRQGAPSVKQSVGSAIQLGSNLLPIGTAAKGITTAAQAAKLPLAKAIGAIGAGAGTGYAFDAGYQIEQGKTGIPTPGLGTAIGAGIPLAGSAAVKATQTAKNQAPRLINSLIKPLLKDFSYGKNPGAAVAKEGIVANDLEELAQKIGERVKQVGAETAQIAKSLDDKLPTATLGKAQGLQLENSLKPINDAMQEAAASNNQTLINRLVEVKDALENNLTLTTVDGKQVITSASPRKLNNLTFTEATNLKTTIGRMTRWTGNPSDDKLVNSTLQKVYRDIKKKIATAAKQVDPELGAQLVAKNERYADLITAESATKYRDKISARQNIISAPIKAGAVAGLLAAPFTGGLSIPTLLIGMGAAGLEKVAASPAVKTRVAAWLASESPGVLANFMTKNPGIAKVLRANYQDIKFPGDAFLETKTGQSVLQSVKNPSVGLSVKDVSKLPKAQATQKTFTGFPDITTKVLGHLEGKSTVSKQFISDLTNRPELKQPERDLIREVLSEFDAPKVSGVSDELIAEARKYKSAEEFVRAQPKLLHGTDAKFDTFDISKRGANEADFQSKNAFFFTDSLDTAKSYGKNLQERYGSFKNPLTIDAEGEMYSGGSSAKDMKQIVRDAVEKAKKDGNDVVIIKNLSDRKDWGNYEPATHYAVLDVNSVKTKSQLTDIYNQAHQTTDKIPVQEFADKVKARLLPLESKAVGEARRGRTGQTYVGERYENIVLPDELRGMVEKYRENIYESPITNSAGDVHFGGDGFDNYFAHTRIEDMAPSPYESANPITGKRSGSVRRVIEIQSDLFQKGRLDDEYNIGFYKQMEVGNINPDVARRIPEGEELIKLDKLVGMEGKRNLPTETVKRWDELSEKAFNTAKTTRTGEVSKLEPYRNTWWERIIREEVRTAAQDGKTKLQFPTGETAMKIEGLGAVNQKWGNYTQKLPLTPENLEKGLRVGDEVGRIPTTDDFTPDVMDKWIITEVLGDGKFKAVPKTIKLFDEGKVREIDFNTASKEEKVFWEGRQAEEFDISGKVDTSNPIYKFYEKDVQKYLRNKYNAKVITDEQGVQWVQMDVPKDANKIPVEAFGVLPFVAGGALQNVMTNK